MYRREETRILKRRRRSGAEAKKGKNVRSRRNSYLKKEKKAKIQKSKNKISFEIKVISRNK